MKVRVLADSVVNKIAAGEVVERPASVVRELVDNALDSGAADIAVYVENGGRSLIRVVDNGSGMERDDAILAFQRHATSKVEREEDLLRISTFGFRGEALSSIAAVAKVRMKTKTAESSVAAEVVIEGGKLVNVSEAGGAQGTDISVQHLFYNTPARRKFLKSERSEELRVKSWLQQSAIPNYGVRYRLFVDGREVLNLAPRGSAVERAASLYKGSTLDFTRKFPVRVDTGNGAEELAIEVEGLVSHPSLAQAEAAAFVVLVNNRLVSDRSIVRAVKDGFDSTLKDREYPLGFIHLRLPPSLVDVNVHPQKSEVRFWDQRILFGLVRDLVYRTVLQFKAPAAVSREIEPPAYYSSQPVSSQPLSVYEPQPAFFSPSAVHSEIRESFSCLRYIGQLMECYLLCEENGRFVIIDMHAAHERYNFNLIRNRVLNGEHLSQTFLLPEQVTLTEEGCLRLCGQEDLLKQFGFQVEAADASSVTLKAAPPMLTPAEAAAVIKEIAAAEPGQEGYGAVKERIDSIAARIACHASIRSGKQMTSEEAYALFEALDSAEFGAACPHGRPVVAAFSKAHVEQWFGRDR